MVSEPEVDDSKTPNWVLVLPVPADASPVPLAHSVRGKPEHIWPYYDEHCRLLGYTWGFTRSDGEKIVIPCTYCQHVKTGAFEWRHVQFPAPRPLYVPRYGAQFSSVAARQLRSSSTKLIVPDELNADAAFKFLLEHDRYEVVSWSGGPKAVDKADWSIFADADKVIIWPAYDSLRYPLTKEDRLAGMEADQKPFMPAKRQPGIAAAEKISARLLQMGCKVVVVKLPEPGASKVDTSISGVIQAGWDVDQVISFALHNVSPPVCANDPPPFPIEESIYTANPANAENDDKERTWQSRCFYKDGRLRECRENVHQILQYLPQWKGCLALDEFANVIRIRKDTPIGQKVGSVWDEDQDFKLGLWLAQALHLFIKSDGILSSAVRATAVANKYHPVRDWLDGLVWDGLPRLEYWLTDYAGVEKTEYSSLIGKLFLIGMVSRIFDPGCKMDTALIMEGLQGEGKSSIARALAGEWFSDTTFVMGDKDSYMALRGKWVYELSELDSFNRSESTRAKAFISSSTDSYRAPYDRISKDHPRQCVFIGTTNQYEYFKDPSGNRRYWPVLCKDELNPIGLAEIRGQLFAEAVHLYRSGMTWWPTKEQQRDLVTPEQEHRELQDVWEIQIHHWLENDCSKQEVTALDILTGAIKMEVSKIDAARGSAMRVGVCMRKLGWPKKRQTTGAREWVYVRPGKVKPVGPISYDNVGENEEPF